jgi:mono/diheme cytochrome c family protein
VISVRSAVVVGVSLAGLLGAAGNVTAQALKDVQTSDTPLVLKAQGSFFVGGDKAEQTRAELGDLGPEGHIAVNQLYVRYMVPQGGDGNLPVVMVHGATLTGKSWETTPDGRMGWDEYFVRKGHPVYVPDQVGRGRSGFNQAVFNNVRAGSAPPASLPRFIRFSDEVVWPNFRFGAKPGAPFSDSQIYEIDTGLRRAVEETYRERGGKTPALPGMGAVVGRGRVDVRLAEGNDGELYLLTKSDGLIRKIVGARETTAPAPAATVPTTNPGQNVNAQPAANVRNPVALTPESVAAGKQAFDTNCAPCHGNLAQGAVKAGMTISIIEEQRGKQPPDLTDEQSDHGSNDGEIFAVIKRGLPPTMMAGYDGRIPDADIWNIVNYLRSLAPRK